MASITKNWGIGGGTLTLTYGGSGKGAITLSSTKNEGLDREMTLSIKTSDNSIRKSFTVKQEGMRELFLLKDGQSFGVTDGDFLVLKQ